MKILNRLTYRNLAKAFALVFLIYGFFNFAVYFASPTLTDEGAQVAVALQILAYYTMEMIVLPLLIVIALFVVTPLAILRRWLNPDSPLLARLTDQQTSRRRY